jgi:glycosyltransferase involved in cell wall biosynthesis
VKRILLLVTSLNRGGIETALLNYLKELQRENQLDVNYHFDLLINREERGTLEQDFLDLGCNIFRMAPMYPWTFHRYKKEFTQFLLQNSQYDVIHSHLEERSFFPMKIALKMQYAAKLVVQVHSDHVMPVLDPKSLFRRFFRSRLRKLNGIAKVAVSKQCAKWLWGDASGVKIIPNPIDLDGLKFNEVLRLKKRTELNVAPETLLLGSVGRLTYPKNHEMMLLTAAQLPHDLDFKLLLVGQGELKAEIARKAGSLGLDDRLIMVGEVEDPGGYFATMDIFLFPSRFEGLGIVAIEAQASGLSVLASDRVPEDAKLTANFEVLEIGGNIPKVEYARRWAKRILEIVQYSDSAFTFPKRHIDAYNTVEKSSYNVQTATQELIMLYY